MTEKNQTHTHTSITRSLDATSKPVAVTSLDTGTDARSHGVAHIRVERLSEHRRENRRVKTRGLWTDVAHAFLLAVSSPAFPLARPMQGVLYIS